MGSEMCIRDRCAAEGLVCSEEQLEAHNGDVDSCEELLALIEAVDSTFVAGTCDESRGDLPRVAASWRASNGRYFTSDEVRDSSTYDCAALPAGAGGETKHRLCYCFSQAPTPAPTPTPTTAAPTVAPTASRAPTLGPTAAPAPLPTLSLIHI